MASDGKAWTSEPRGGLAFCVLGSGSRGNATLLALAGPGGTEHVLLDCGLSPRMTDARLARHGLTIADLSAILLTHLDQDHFAPGWPKQVRRLGLAVHVHRRHRRRALRLGLDGRTMKVFSGPFRCGARTAVAPLLLAHDHLGTVGFVIEHRGARLGFATDLGRVPEAMADHFSELDALAIESNYDPHMQRLSDRPAFVKRRITGGLGHLSNAQSLDAVLRIEARSRLSHVVPLHLSSQCNDPDLVRRLYADRAPHLLERLTITSQHEPTSMLSVPAGAPPAILAAPRSGEQLAMF